MLTDVVGYSYWENTSLFEFVADVPVEGIDRGFQR